MTLAVLGGCLVGTIVFLFCWETGTRAKQVVVALYVVSWIIDHVIHTAMCIQLIMQIGLCLYYAFWYKIDQLQM